MSDFIFPECVWCDMEGFDSAVLCRKRTPEQMTKEQELLDALKEGK